VRHVVTDSSIDSTPGGPAGSDTADNNVATDAGEPQAAGEQTPSDVEPSVEESLKAEVTRLKDQLLRALADFDNFRKRSRREISDAERVAREDTLRELLPVFDNLERASQHAVEATDVQSLNEGIQMVMRQFLDTLTKLNVERVQSVGLPFDPAVHEAVQQVESSELPPGAVAHELLAGYRVGDRLIRPAMVVVVKPAAN
jgi:molecular chaperone GrpE